MRMCHFRVQNSPLVMNNFFLVQTITITFIYLLALFVVQNLKKKSYSGSRVMRMRHFWAQNGPFAPNKFFWKIIKITLIYLLAPFIAQNFLKILLVDPGLWGCAISGPKMRIFSENLLMSLVSFIHAYLYAKNQTEISLAKSHFWQ